MGLAKKVALSLALITATYAPIRNARAQDTQDSYGIENAVIADEPGPAMIRPGIALKHRMVNDQTESVEDYMQKQALNKVLFIGISEDRKATYDCIKRALRASDDICLGMPKLSRTQARDLEQRMLSTREDFIYTNDAKTEATSSDTSVCNVFYNELSKRAASGRIVGLKQPTNLRSQEHVCLGDTGNKGRLAILCNEEIFLDEMQAHADKDAYAFLMIESPQDANAYAKISEEAGQPVEVRAITDAEFLSNPWWRQGSKWVRNYLRMCLDLRIPEKTHYLSNGRVYKVK
ncbi:hypothetical protein HY641_00350 [Candidatus Woesearchaeota archaeon]|nr:hypothetical protein [Candidatus Woesearchaeota archaeon]